MLAELKIENVAVIEKAGVRFTPGLNVLTGETGAGKSILIDSINAILGNRTSRELVRSGAHKACIWATSSCLAKLKLSIIHFHKQNAPILLQENVGMVGFLGLPQAGQAQVVLPV